MLKERIRGCTVLQGLKLRLNVASHIRLESLTCEHVVSLVIENSQLFNLAQAFFHLSKLLVEV